MNWLAYLSDMTPYFVCAGLIVTLFVAVNLHGRRLGRHDEWMRVLELRVENLHKERKSQLVRSLQRPRRRINETEPEPPPLSQAATIDVDDSWILTKDTRKYPKPKREGEG